MSNIITNVIARFGDLSGQRLIEITHSDGPWADVTEGGTRTNNQQISHKALASYGAKLPPDLEEARQHINRVRDDRPFVADDPDAGDRVLAVGYRIDDALRQVDVISFETYPDPKVP